MSIRCASIIVLTILLALVVGCGPAAPTVTPAAPISTTLSAASEPVPTATALVPTAVPPTEAGNATLGEAPGPGEAVIWYLGHCGYAVRTQNHLLIFDYQRRRDGPETKPQPAQPALENGFVVPEQLAGLRVRVFVSHQHDDHYDPVIFGWQSVITDIAYFFGWQARQTDDPAFHFMVGPRAEWQSDDMEVYTINSHHSGVPEVAYLVKVDGLVIYHNGDYQGDFRQDYPFLQEISSQIDLAFVLRDYDEQSTTYFPQNMDLSQRFAPRAIFPMHDSAERGHYAEFARVYLAKLPGLPVHYAQHIGERFLFQDGQIVGGGGPAAPTAAPPMTAATQTPLSPSDTPTPMTAEYLIAECAKAMGGIEKIDALETMRFTQRFPDHAGLIHYEIKRPNLVRMGDQLVFDGKRGAWLEGTNADGTSKRGELVPEEEWKDFEVDISWYVPAFFDYPAEYVGTERLDDTETRKLQVRLPLGAVMTYYLDAQTYLVLKATAHFTMGGEEHHPERIYSDYRLSDGILYPHAFTYEGRDGVFTATMVKLEFNVPLEDERFAIPTSAQAPALAAIPVDTVDQVERLHTLSGHSDRVTALAFLGTFFMSPRPTWT